MGVAPRKVGPVGIIVCLVAVSGMQTFSAEGPSSALGSVGQELPVLAAGAWGDLPVSEAANAWMVEAGLAAGFTGGVRRVRKDSSGSLACSQPCGLPQLRFSSELIDAIRDVSAPVSPVTMCRDCEVRSIRLAFRQADGTVRTLAVEWDVTTAAKVDPRIRALHEHILKIAGW